VCVLKITVYKKIKVAYYREAVRLAPRFADAYSNLGNALKQQGKVDEAVSCYEAALAIRPDFAAAHGNLGAALLDAGRLDEAAKTLKHAVTTPLTYTHVL
jgi:protein O-GlcNAc transferase